MLCPPGLNLRTAQKIHEHVRKAGQRLRSRADLLRVSQLGSKTFEQCAGFLRVVGSDPLDNTMIHPESYPVARALLGSVAAEPRHLQQKEAWQEKWAPKLAQFAADPSRVKAFCGSVGPGVQPGLEETTVGDIAKFLCSPGDLADPRRAQAPQALRAGADRCSPATRRPRVCLCLCSRAGFGPRRSGARPVFSLLRVSCTLLCCSWLDRA